MNEYRYNIHLCQFNNYYNRILKTVDDYTPYIIHSYSANIDINDYEKTSITINYNNFLATPNYLVLEDLVENTISRWYVIKCRQLRGQQYRVDIKRDVLVDYWDVIKHSPCIIQKGYVDNNNVLVFNREQQEYNKIKTKELLIKDKTGIGYVVGFIARDSNYEEDGSPKKINSSYTGEIQVDFDYNSLSQTVKNRMAIGTASPVGYFINKKMTNVEINSFQTIIRQGRGDYYTYASTTDVPLRVYGSYTNINEFANIDINYRQQKPSITEHTSIDGTTSRYYDEVSPSYDKVRDNIVMPFYNRINQIVASKLNNIVSRYDDAYYRHILDVSDSDYNFYKSFNNKICEINGVYYKCVFKEEKGTSGTKVNDNYTFGYYIRQSLPTNTDLQQITDYHNLVIDNDDLTTSDINIQFNNYNCYVQLVQQNTEVYTYLTPSTSRNHLIDNPYDMFVIPYSDDYEYEVNSTNYRANKNMAINLAQAICEASAKTYDIQLVPYCPFTIQDNDWSLINSQSIHISSDDSIIGYYFWADKSSITFSIDETREELTLSNNPSYKEITQLNRYVLCSPDKNSQWEFNPCMNKGITKWNISLDYRPFTSYVKVQPEWDWLYGNSDYNNMTDYRGLIFNGSYSLTQLNDAWASYLNTNKNYQQIFDTQINTQIKQFDIQNKAAWDTMFARSFDFGFLGTGMIGMPVRAEYNSREQLMQEELQRLSLSSQRKLFNYQLDNIKNQPDTLKKLTSINIDFRLFPFVEIYETSEQEKLLFRDNIRYNGMTIMVVGYIENYLKDNDETFIQATLIRFNDFNKQENDFTLVQEINNELNQGIYIVKENE